VVNFEDLGPILARGTADDPNLKFIPTPFQFQLTEGEEPSLETFVFQALGAASSCWETLEGAGVFDSTRAKEIGDVLCATIRQLMVPVEKTEYHVELGGQRFTREQWQVVLEYAKGTSAKVSLNTPPQGSPGSDDGWTHP
jgi:hypothetical protein